MKESLTRQLRTHGFNEKQIKRIFNLLNYRKIKSNMVGAFKVENLWTTFYVANEDFSEIEYIVGFSTDFILGVK